MSGPAPEAGGPGPDAGRPAPDAGRPAPDAGGPAPEVGDAVPDAGDAAADSGGPDAGADRRPRVERAVRGTLAGALILEALMVLFVPRTIAPLDDRGLTGARLAFLLGLAGALVVAAALQRSRAGLVLGSVLQLPVIATGVLVGVMYVLGLLFTGVWIYLLRIRRELLGPTPPAGAP